MKKRAWIAVVIATFFVGACAERLSAPSNLEGSLITGRWGGDHVLLVLSDTGGTVEFDCARGTILEPVRPDSQGRFTSKGTYVAGEPGPARISDVAAEQPATYVGTIRGTELTLSVMLTANAQSVGAFMLTRDSPGLLRRCV